METRADFGRMSPARVKEEVDTDLLEMPLIKEEPAFLDEKECVKEECEDSTDGYGVSETAIPNLYAEHEVKDELVLGPERPHRPTVGLVVRAPTIMSSAAVSDRGRSCAVRLERLLPDAARRSCRVGRRTYKLRAAEPAAAASYQCHHCGERFTNKSVLKKHVHTHSPLHNAAVGDYGLERHQILHGGKKLYKKTHVIIQTGEKPFGCHCGYKSSLKSNLRRHLMTHTDEKPFRCSHCGQGFSRKAHLQTHLMSHTGEKPFTCSRCAYKCRTKTGLRTHVMSHTGEKPFSCSHCSHKCKRKVDLQAHLITHTDQKPFTCSHCAYKCKRKADLRTHVMSHTGEKPFSCSHCSYKCKRNVDLQAHLMIHTGQKPFRCSHCGFKCRRKTHLRSHLVTHRAL
ncbi:gastrula zinc finger protein XlCGF46.1-like [Cydia pomonella]|uniref:gastrula zinc finger protein XlCGF46.1-like n=1 Tax=Cydia pomonella TaxID=82600 RepID=UPI002ADD5B21|nr:gastrula zinc finger protein XlCGF46.1-like [Cydia pomonella]